MLTIIGDNMRDLPVYALRYALGRKTFAPLTVIEWLSPQVGELPPNTAQIMARDIREWQQASYHPEGWWTDHDREQWNGLLKLLDERGACEK